MSTIAEPETVKPVDPSDATSRRSFLKHVLAASATAGVASLAAACSQTPPKPVPGPAVPSATTAGGKLGEVLKRGSIRVGVNLTIAPYGFEDANGKPDGFDPAIARILAKQLFKDPNKVEFVEQEFDARIPNLLSGKTDISVQLTTVTAERAQVVDFCIPYYREGTGLLLRKDSPYNSAKEMIGKGVSISGLQNTYLEDTIHKGVPDAKVIAFDNVSAAYLALDTGRVDATVSDVSVSQYYVARFPDKYKTIKDSWETVSYAAMIAPGDQRWLNYLNTAFHEMMTGIDWPDYHDAFLKYFGVDLARAPSGFPVEFGVRV